MTAWVILKCEGALAGYPALFMIAELSTAPKPPQEMRTTAFTVFARSARASKLIGSTVYTGDTSIGQIEDVLVDLDHETLAAVVLSVGGFLGIGNKLVAVPVRPSMENRPHRGTMMGLL